jgi:hypothetical protein
VAHRVGGDHDRGLAHGGAEIGGDLRQQQSVTRTMAWLAKPATASRMIERVGTLSAGEADEIWALLGVPGPSGCAVVRGRERDRALTGWAWRAFYREIAGTKQQ